MRLTDLNSDFSKGGADGSSRFLTDSPSVDDGNSARHLHSYRNRVLQTVAFPDDQDLETSMIGASGEAVMAAGIAGIGSRAEQRNLHLALKRLVDIVGSAVGLLMLSPLLILVAVIIKTTSAGPVFFRQARTGLGNEPFQILKFRSMYTDRCDHTGVAQTTADDPRITPIGRVLRKTNIDELPQLINVLFGDMSLVGPRPHVPGMLAVGVPYEELVPGYERRHAMRPGITGLAQAHGLRGPTTEVEPAVMRVVRDVEYIRDFSIWLDIRILVRTFVNEFVGGNGF